MVAASPDLRIVQDLRQGALPDQVDQAAPVGLFVGFLAVDGHGDQHVARRVEHVVAGEGAAVDLVRVPQQLGHAVGVHHGQPGTIALRRSAGDLRIVFVHHPGGARRHAEGAAPGDHGAIEARVAVGEVMVEPEAAGRVVGEVGDDVPVAYVDDAVLHELGLHEQVGADVLEGGDESAADDAVEVRSGYQPHAQRTSSTEARGSFRALATPAWVTLPACTLSPRAKGRFSCIAC